MSAANWLWSLGGLAAATALALACNPGTQAGGPMLLGRPECPHHWDSTRTAWPEPLAGPTLNVPEFHDCQKFIVAEGAQLTYIELFAIFAWDSLDHLIAALDTTSQLTQSGMRSASAAEIFAEGSYPALTITPGISCVLFYWRAGAWRVKVVPRSAMGGNCRGFPNPSEFSVAELEVRRTQVEDFAESDYPPVARWDWDATHQKQYLGFKCGRAWCEAGEAGFAHSPDYVVPAALPPEYRRTRMIKGYYDEQVLATAKGPPRPSGILGTILPDQNLGRRDAPGAFTGWTPIAQVALSRDDPDYKAKFNFTPGQPTDLQLPTIKFCLGTAAECYGGRGMPTTGPDCKGTWLATPVGLGPPSPPFLFSDIQGPTGSHHPRCVTRRDHSVALGATTLPGTVRWRWTERDETAWGRCAKGCCEVD